ncbi:uncharacterized protein LOC130215450 [Danio aesculapii]|uniref:uncharacterized protein LOC130215450 n=1 Tax=Danio aesculapii TaxID=1142201 RepID=UPI0024BFE8F2|nr:uncharacterized protein LOC130215450 [Danio aesculapii]XP_056303233.1 uncharacterized protein LOC130215450 [Danio aesculapii]
MSRKVYLTVSDEIEVMGKKSVTLSSGVSELKNGDHIQWRFGNEDTLIAEINKQTNRFRLSVFDVLDGRFTERLELDEETGSLTITDITTEHAGVYKLQNNNETNSVKLILSGKSKVVSVKMRNSVTLNSGVTEMMDGDQIQWWIGDKDTLIAEIIQQTNRFSVFDDVLDGRFRDRLKLDNKTASLTITDIRTEHAGVYKLQTNYIDFAFHLIVYDEISVKKGKSVTLSSGLTELKNDQIQWMFGHKGTLIAQLNWRNRFSVFDDVLDGRFRDRLKLDNKTASLTITDTRTEHAGVYKLQINNTDFTFHLTVCDEISVKEGDSVTLNSDLTKLKKYDQIEWRFGDEDTLIAEIIQEINRFSVFDDVLDGRFRDRLKLDNKTGSLTITDTRAEHAGLYKIQTNYFRNSFLLVVCDSVYCCGPTEAAIRLVLSALVGVAIVIIVLYDVRSRRAEPS